MTVGLDPAHLTPTASLNRVRFVAMPGLALPPDLPGRTGYALLSARALHDLAWASAESIGLGPANSDDPAVTLHHLDRVLEDGSPAARAAAEAIVCRFGARLGWLVVTLRRGDPASRAARPDWDETYWQHWVTISTVYLGGGIVSGRIGSRVVVCASRVLTESGMTDCTLRLAPWPEHLPLVGAARSIAGAPTAVVLDFGHSFVKRAVAGYADGALTALQLLPSLPARWTTLSPGADPIPAVIEALGVEMVQTIAETWSVARTANDGLATTIVASLASYLRDGQPLARQGGAYSYLLALSDNLARWLSNRVSQAVGCPISVRLLHDGTAAAHALAGERHAAVMTLGTALGVGFPPPSENATPQSPHLTVHDAR